MIQVKEDRQNERVYFQIYHLGEITGKSIRHGFFTYAKFLKDETNKEILRHPKGGRIYYIRCAPGRRPRRHRASAPYETHANRCGFLRKSMGWQVFGFNSMEFGYGVGSAGAGLNTAPDYAKYVEFGTSRMKKRPSLWNGIQATDTDAERFFEAAFKRAVQ